MKCNLAVLTLAVCLLTSLGTAHAALLSNLFAGGSLTVADKLFDQFTLNFSGTSDGRVINAGNIDVTTLGPVGPNPLDPGPGLRFTVLNEELRVRGDGVFAYADLQFGFRVSVLDPNFRIKDNSMLSNNTLSLDADGVNDLGTYIRETTGTLPGLSNLGVISVEESVLDDVAAINLAAMNTFAPQHEIWVSKNILVWSQDDTDTASLNYFEQRFSQVQTVPEPGMLALLAAAGLAGWLIRRRHTQLA